MNHKVDLAMFVSVSVCMCVSCWCKAIHQFKWTCVCNMDLHKHDKRCPSLPQTTSTKVRATSVSGPSGGMRFSNASAEPADNPPKAPEPTCCTTALRPSYI